MARSLTAISIRFLPYALFGVAASCWRAARGRMVDGLYTTPAHCAPSLNFTGASFFQALLPFWTVLCDIACHYCHHAAPTTHAPRAHSPRRCCAAAPAACGEHGRGAGDRHIWRRALASIMYAARFRFSASQLLHGSGTLRGTFSGEPWRRTAPFTCLLTTPCLPLNWPHCATPRLFISPQLPASWALSPLCLCAAFPSISHHLMRRFVSAADAALSCRRKRLAGVPTFSSCVPRRSRVPRWDAAKRRQHRRLLLLTATHYPSATATRRVAWHARA